MKLRELRDIIIDRVRIVRDFDELYSGMMSDTPDDILNCEIDWVSSDVVWRGADWIVVTGIRVK